MFHTMHFQGIFPDLPWLNIHSLVHLHAGRPKVTTASYYEHGKDSKVSVKMILYNGSFGEYSIIFIELTKWQQVKLNYFVSTFPEPCPPPTHTHTQYMLMNGFWERGFIYVKARFQQDKIITSKSLSAVVKTIYRLIVNKSIKIRHHVK